MIYVIIEKLRSSLFFSSLEYHVLSSVLLFSVTSYSVVCFTADHLGLTFLHHLIVPNRNPLISQTFLLTAPAQGAWPAQTPPWQKVLWAHLTAGRETSMAAWMGTELCWRGQWIRVILWSATLLKEKCNCSSSWYGQKTFTVSVWVDLLWLIGFRGTWA